MSDKEKPVKEKEPDAETRGSTGGGPPPKDPPGGGG